MQLEFKLKGVSELEKLLKALPEELAQKTVDSAMRAAGNVIRKEAQMRAPVYDGPVRIINVKGRRRALVPRLLKMSIRVFKVKTNDNSVLYQIGPRSIRVAGVKANPFYAHMMEFGTRKVHARPFLRPALDAKKEEALQVLAKHLEKGIEKATKKLAAQYKTGG